MSLLNTLDEYTLNKIYKMLYDDMVVGVVDEYIKKEIKKITKLIMRKKMVEASDLYLALLKQFKTKKDKIKFIIGSIEAVKKIHKPLNKMLNEMKKTDEWFEDGEEIDPIDIIYTFEVLPVHLLNRK